MFLPIADEYNLGETIDVAEHVQNRHCPACKRTVYKFRKCIFLKKNEKMFVDVFLYKSKKDFRYHFLTKNKIKTEILNL